MAEKKAIAWRLVAMAFTIALVAPPLTLAAELTPAEILDRVDDLFRGSSSHGRAKMTVRTRNWSRSLVMEFWSEGTDHSLVRILEPKKEKGTATLKSGRDLWNYLPKVKRVVKLPSSMMSASWMGSHFSNDDLVRDSRMTEDYTFEVTFQGARNGDEIVELTCTPKPEAPVVWGKVVVTVANDSYMPRTIRYYDEDMDLARTLSYHDPKELGGRTLPVRMEMQPIDEPDEITVVEYEQIEFDIELDDDTFSLRTLQR